MSTLRVIATFLIIASFASVLRAADEIVLKDGTRVVGTIKKLQKGELEIEVASSTDGTLSFKFEDIVSIKTDDPQKIELDNGSVLNGPLIIEDGGARVADESAGEVRIDIDKITKLNVPPRPPVTRKGFIGINGRVADGNSRTKTAQAVLDYVARTESTRITIRGDWNYAENEGELAQRNAQGSLKYDVFVSERAFLYMSALFVGDDFADLNLRTALSAGAGYQFVDEELDDTNWEFYEEIGVAFFNEDFEGSAADSRYTAGRLSGRFDKTFGDDRIILFHYHEFYFGFEDQEDLNALTQQGVRFNIIDNFYATMQVNFDWDNTPAPGRKRTDTEYLWGLGYNFDF